MAFDPKLRSPNEQPLFIIGAIFSSFIWLIVVLTIVGLFYGIFIALAILAGHALFLARIRGNGVRVSERQLPDLYARVRAAAEKLGLPQIPEVYVVQEGGALNAFATKLLSRKYVILYSDLLDQCHDPRQLDFVVGHEVGHLAAGHLTWNAFLAPFHLIPWLAPAYSRACEYTSDRCGLLVAQDLEQSMRGLVVLAAGGKVAGQADLNVFMEQTQETGNFWMAVLELSISHPFLCKRAAALQKLTQPSTVAAVSRNPIACLLAPMFGAMAGGSSAGPLLMIMVVMGMLAAIAIPNFIRYQERVRQAQLQGEGSSASSSDTKETSVNEQTLSAEDRESLEWIKQVRRQSATHKKNQPPAEETEEDDD